MALLLAAAAAFLLRKPEAALAGAPGMAFRLGLLRSQLRRAAHIYALRHSPATKNAALLNALKEELFALESEKLSGTISPAEYAEAKAALETVLRRALKERANGRAKPRMELAVDTFVVGSPALVPSNAELSSFFGDF